MWCMGFLTTNIDIRTSNFVESLINLLDLLRNRCENALGQPLWVDTEGGEICNRIATVI